MSEAVGRHAVALASVVELARRAGAQRVVLLIDEGDRAQATMIEWAGDGSLELTEEGVTEPVAAATIAQVAPTELPDVTAVPPSALSVDEATGELAAPLGVLAALAGAVLALAAAFGGRSVATAEFASREPDQPFMLAARPGEPVVAQIGGETYAFPEGWP